MIKPERMDYLEKGAYMDRRIDILLLIVLILAMLSVILK